MTQLQELRTVTGIWTSVALMLFTGTLVVQGSPTPSSPVREAVLAVKRKANDRYADVGSAMKNYSAALDEIVRIRVIIEQEKKEQEKQGDDGNNIDPKLVLRLAKAYTSVAKATEKMAKYADKLDPMNWSPYYLDQVHELKVYRQRDIDKRRKAISEHKQLLDIPEAERSAVQYSRVITLEIRIEATAARLVIFEKTLDIFDRINGFVSVNDRIAEKYSKICTNMSEAYMEQAETMFAMFRYQGLKEIDQAVDRIIRQPEKLLKEVRRARQEWIKVKKDIKNIIGESDVKRGTN